MYCNITSCPKGQKMIYPAGECCKCVPGCRPDMIETTCACPATCENKKPVCDTSKCKEGCECPSGTFNNGTNCVKQHDCYCTVNGTRHEPNSRWKCGHCDQCKCVGGKVHKAKVCNIVHCPAGHRLERPDHECCRCVQVTTTAQTTTTQPSTSTPSTIPPTTQPPICRYNNKTHKINDTWDVSLCEFCECILDKDGNPMVNCIRQKCKACPAGTYPKKVDYQCCEICVPIPTTIPTTTPTTEKSTTTTPSTTSTTEIPTTTPAPRCFYGNKTYEPGDSWQPSECETCKCSINANGHAAVVCRVTDCGTIECPPGFHPVKVPGECCKKCVPRPTTQLPSTTSPTTQSTTPSTTPTTTKPPTTPTTAPPVCTYNGKDYDIGDTWTRDCMTCTCRLINGKADTECRKTPCPPMTCPVGTQEVLKKGDCCPICEKLPSTTTPSTTPTTTPSTTSSTTPSTTSAPTPTQPEPTTQPRSNVCRYNGKEYEIGKKWNTTICETCSCTANIHGFAKIDCVTEQCPACPTGSTPVMTKDKCCSCCPGGAMTAPPTKLPASKPCTIEKKMNYLVDDNNCKTDIKYEQNTCSGQCQSSAKAGRNSTALLDCNCCKPAGFKSVTQVNYLCPDGRFFKRDHVVFTACSCSPCDDELDGLTYIDINS